MKLKLSVFVFFSAICKKKKNPPKKFSQKFTPLAKVYKETSQVESCCCHLFKVSFPQKQNNEMTNKTFRNKRLTGKDHLKVLHWKEHLQFHTRTKCNCDRVDCSQPLYSHTRKKKRARWARSKQGWGVGSVSKVSKKNRECRHLWKKKDLLGSSPCYRLVTNSSAPWPFH